MESFDSGGVRIAYIDVPAAKEPGDPVLLIHGFASTHAVNWVNTLWVKTLTGSNAMAGLTFFFMVIPSLFAPLMGVWLDRVRRKPFLVWGNVASAVMVLPLVLVRHRRAQRAVLTHRWPPRAGAGARP